MEPNKFLTNGKTKIVNGSILSPEMGNLRLVLIPCSESGKPETNLHSLLNKKWRTVAAELKGWYSNHINFKMGNIQTTALNSDIWGVHALMLDKNGAVDDKAVASCLAKVAALAKAENASLHVSELTVNSFPKIVDILTINMVEKGTAVYYYKEVQAE